MESRQVRGFGASWLGLQGPPWLSRSRRLQGAEGVPPDPSAPWSHGLRLCPPGKGHRS